MSIQLKAAEQAVKLLNAAQAKYIVVMPTGETFQAGDLSLAPPAKVRTRTRKHPVGTFQAIYLPVIGNLPVNGFAKITAPPGITADELRSATSAWCTHTWGNGNHMSTVNKAAGTVEVLRVG